MIGAGVFAAIGPAARAAGSGLLVGLAIAAVVAYCNATSSAQLGAIYPAMAANGDLPRVLDAVHPDYRVPHRAELAAGAAVTVLVLVADLRSAIGFSSFAVLTYYAIANAAAWTLPAAQRRWPCMLSVLGVAGCALLAFTLPEVSVLVGGGVLALGALIWFVRAALPSRPTTATD